MTHLSRLLASSPLQTSGIWGEATFWVLDNPAARAVRLSKWESLIRVAYSETTYTGLRAAVLEHLERAGVSGEENRWRKPDLTSALQRALEEAAGITPDLVGEKSFSALGSLPQAGFTQVLESWKRQRAIAFLRAVHSFVKQRPTQHRGGSPS